MRPPLQGRRHLRCTFALAVMLVTALAGPAFARANVLVGAATLAARVDSNPAGSAEAFSFTAAAGGTVAKLNLYVAGAPTATSAIVGLYADASGHPGALLAQGTIASPVADAWNSVNVSPTAVTAGTPYWIAVLVPSGGGTLSFRDGSPTPPSGPAETASSTTLTALPAQWTTGGAFADSPLSATAETAAAPSVGLAPTSFSFAVSAGGSATAQTLHLSNLGGGILDWSITSDSPWLAAIPASGVGPADITVTPDTAALAPGSYNANLTVSAPGASNPTTVVPVTLTVNPAGSGDTTAPSVALTAPTDGSTVSGPVSLSATASDNIGVAGLQFTVDGGGIGAELTAGPYGITWPAKVELSSALMILGRSAEPARSSASASSRMQE